MTHPLAGGPNVYPGNSSIDYQGADVTPQNFINV